MKQMRKFWAYIRYIVFSDELSFDVRTANMICLVGVISLSFATLVRVVSGAGMPIISVMLALVFTTAFFLYLTYRYNLFGFVLWFLLFVICDILMPITLFVIGGADSGIAAFCVMGTTAILLLTSGKQRIIMVSTNVLLLLACFLFAAYHPEWVKQFDPSQPLVQTFDNFQAYVIATLFVGACLIFQRYMYSQEKAKVESTITALEKERQVTFAFFDASPHINLLFNDRFELVDCNPAILQIANGTLSKDEIIARLPEIIAEAAPVLQPGGRPSASLGLWLEKTAREGETHFETVLQFHGSTYNLSVIMKRIPYEDSFAIVVFLVDQTELYVARSEALDSAKAKSVFLANMSHEIRTPLNAVISMTSIGKSAAELSRKDYAFTQIGNAADHLLGVINDILDMSKIEADKFELNKTAFNLESMLHRVANVMSFRTSEKRQHFTVHLDEDAPRGIIADEQRLAQIVTNLLSNAVKFTPDGGSIELAVSLVEKRIDTSILHFAVRDTGIGLTEAQAARVFRSFEQAESNTTRKFGGTGLGLAISKSFVEKMGGTISVTSEPGKGSTFEFTINTKPAKVFDSLTLDPSIAIGTIRSLVICVDEESRVQSAIFAKRLGAPCDLVATEGEALALLAEQHYDVCFLDWQTGDENSSELIRRIKTENLADKVVLNAYLYQMVAIEAFNTEGLVDGLITRPLFFSDCVHIFNDLFGQSASVVEPEKTLEEEDFTGFSLLLAEDVELNKEIVCALLEPLGFSIEWARDGREALQMFEANPNRYDLILMDMQMPEMDGLEAARRIRALKVFRAKDIPIIALTANVFKEDVDRSIAAGMDDHLGKPIDFDVLVAMLRRHLR